MIRRRVMALLILGPAVLATVLVACSGERHPLSVPNTPVTGFGGYHLRAPVTELEGDWVVPAITGGSPTAHASTWIGAQNQDDAFIQIGTTEDDWLGKPAYNAFWSDTDVGFRPQELLPLRPGDEVSARLVKGATGWSGTIEDSTTGRVVSVPPSVHYAPYSAMQVSEWAQEDPAIPDGSDDEPYPNMTQVTFTNLKANNQAPPLSYKDATALASPNGIVLIPSGVQNNSFRLQQGTPSQEQYLRNIGALDLAYNLFAEPGVRGGGTTAGNGRALIGAIDTFDSQVSTEQWPANSVLDIQRLVAHDRTLVQDLQTWEAAGESRARLTQVSADTQLNPQLSNAIRADLGIPPIGLDRP